MESSQTLDRKQKELVALGVSVAAGCKPCTVYHLEAARQAGGADGEIRRAIDIAVAVRKDATRIIDAWSLYPVDGSSELKIQTNPSGSLIDELIAVAASFAVNCVSSLEAHLGIAYDLGASSRHIETVLAIARAVRKVAQEKVESAITRTEHGRTEQGSDDFRCCGVQSAAGAPCRRPASPAG